MSKQKSFVLNDESVMNTYGFYVLNSQIDLDRMKTNGVLLYMHKRGEVHGRWENFRVEGTKLWGDPVFDVDDPESAKIAGKVDRGFLKGASLYLHFTPETRFVELDGKMYGENLEAWEGSIVDIPSGSTCVKLFGENGELSDEDVKGFLLAAQPSKIPKIIDMNNFKFTGVALAALAAAGVTNTEDGDQVSDFIVKLAGELKTEKENGVKLSGELKTFKETQANALVEGAIAEGKLLETQKEKYVALAVQDYALAAGIIADLKGKVTLSGQVTQTTKIEEDKEKANWTYGEWMDKDPKGLELMATTDPEKFKNLKP